MFVKITLPEYKLQIVLDSQPTSIKKKKRVKFEESFVDASQVANPLTEGRILRKWEDDRKVTLQH